MYTEHTHSEYEEGMVAIDVWYSVLYRLKGDRFKTLENFGEWEPAFARYKTLENDSKYELVVLNEMQTHEITKLCAERDEPNETTNN
jgi:hypothetical protein